jgi:transcriptional regulator with XRE-family HTH domain
MPPTMTTGPAGGYSHGGKHLRFPRWEANVAGPPRSLNVMTSVAPARDQRLGDLLRHWRSIRRVSQVDLAYEAGTTPRYVSFVETGRSSPSAAMVLRLATALDVPLRERNGLLLAAGYAPAYGQADLSSPGMSVVRRVLDAMLTQHLPYPAVVMDRR